MAKKENKKRFIIEKEKVLLVEGKDEVQFLTALFNVKNIQNVQVIDTGGRDKFKKDFLTLKNTPGFNKVTSLGIIQDADDNAQDRFDSICSTLEKCSLPAPDQMASFTSETPKVGIFILPDCQSEGMLESLCLSTIKSKNKVLKCIDDFIQCLEQKPKNIDKARCRAFLSAMQEDTPSLGVAAQKGYWNFDSDKLKPLLDFLSNL